MIENISLYQNIQIPKNFAFKSKQESFPVTSPIENVSMSGVDALASYNSAFVNDKSVFNIPLLKPVNLPSDINEIDGERIYNSKGVLECIVKNTGDKKYVYTNNDNEVPGIDNLKIYSNKTGNLLFEQDEYCWSEYENKNVQHKGMWISEFDPITGEESFVTQYVDGKPNMKKVMINNSDSSGGCISYYYDNAEYNVHMCNAQGTILYDKMYDSNGKLKHTYYNETKTDGNIRKEIRYSNGKEVSRDITERQAVQNSEYQKYLNNPELKPAECPEFITNIDNIEGQKTYYSNGQLESVETSDGKTYEISLDGQCITMHDGNKTIEFADVGRFGERNCTIIEESGSVRKETHYNGKDGNELSFVSYTKGNIEKMVCYQNGVIYNYMEHENSDSDCWKNIIDIEFAPNGGILWLREGDEY